MLAPDARDEHDEDDPAAILDHLPDQYRAQFRAEYAAAVEQAKRPEQYQMLRRLLRLWRLRAAAYADPGYAERLSDAAPTAETDVRFEDTEATKR